MTDLLSSQSDAPSEESPPTFSTVVVAVTVVRGVDPVATLSAVAEQRHPVEAVYVVGGDEVDRADSVEDLEQLSATLDASVDYVWILHGDTRPRPDALGALVHESDRNDGSLSGSKLLVDGTRDTLEAVGSATDVFGEPYSGLDSGEVDLEQYDVVREVAFVPSVSMLVRRDLLRGLKGLDPQLPPVSAGLDLSQRVRIAGGRVVVVPSSEVFHQGRCGRGDGGWREQAGRLRAMIKAYRPITLLWMLPFAFLTGLLDSIGSLLLGRWRLAPRYALTWLWNLARLPQTLGLRRNVAKVRQVGDEELFRYQVRGSVRLRQLGLELSELILGVFDDDRLMARRTVAAINSSGAWAALVTLLVGGVGLRSILFSGMPLVGFAAPSADDPSSVLSRFMGGWNRAGLGSDQAIHPVSALTAAIDFVLPGGEMAARLTMTVFAVVLAVFGVARLASRLRVGGAGGYVGGGVAMFGPAAASMAGVGWWSGVLSIGILPWALAAVVILPASQRWVLLARAGRVTVLVGLLGFLNPWLALAPLLFAVAVRTMGRFPIDIRVAIVGTIGSLSGAAYVGTRPERLLDGGLAGLEPALTDWAVLAVLVVIAMLAGSWRVGFLTAVMVFGAFVAGRYVGPDLQIALLAVAACGTGLAVAAVFKRSSGRGIRGWVAIGVGLAAVAVAMPSLLPGRLGLPADRWAETLEFARLEPTGVERTLLIATEAGQLPGDSRPGPGFWYRTVEAGLPTLDQLIIGSPGAGDEALATTVNQLASGSSLTPGAELAEYGIRWLVVVDDAATLLRPALSAQADLQALPLADGFLVYDNLSVRTVAETPAGAVWESEGAAFVGAASDEVRLALQGDGRWRPNWRPDEWAGRVDGGEGVVRFAGDRTVFWISIVGVGVLLAGAALAVVGRLKQR